MAVLDADLLSHEEVGLLIEGCSRTSFTGSRNAMLIALLWRCGLRISEALALHPKDIDTRARTLVVQRGKGGKRRVVGIDRSTSTMLERWIAIRQSRGLTAATPLLSTCRGGRLDPSYVRHLLPRLARRAGIQKRVHAHGLRHRFAVDLISEGAPITTVRDLLGHGSIAVTDTYLRRIGVSQAIDFNRNRDWAFV